MAIIRKIEIKNFRGIKDFSWNPTAGINCLIGPGDSGKSSIIEAIDLCLSASRSVQFADTDFHNLNVSEPISIAITIGALDDLLKNIESYGMFVRGYHNESGNIDDEPHKDAEVVLTLSLIVKDDLEPLWSLFSERAQAQDISRNLAQTHRARIAPTRISAGGGYNLGWRRGSILNRLSQEKPDASAALLKAARDARSTFGSEAQVQLGDTLQIVEEIAKELGVPVGDHLKAMLDAHSVSFTGGTVSLHDDGGVPLRGLGMGSARLLVAGMQRRAASASSIILIDEMEYGLEPHRIIRLLMSLGSKEKKPPLQAFISTHSPVALRELSGPQLFVLRHDASSHKICSVGTDNAVQGTIRKFPEAFLATSVVVCEGPTEIGLIRGLDLHRVDTNAISIAANGVALVDGGGSETLKRAAAFLSLGYRVAMLRDSDREPDHNGESKFKNAGGTIFCWQKGRALEDELFLGLSDNGIAQLLNHAVAVKGENLVNDQIKSASKNAFDLEHMLEAIINGFSTTDRMVLAQAAKSQHNGWFKSITSMESAAREIVGPELLVADATFRAEVDGLFNWIASAAP